MYSTKNDSLSLSTKPENDTLFSSTPRGKKYASGNISTQGQRLYLLLMNQELHDTVSATKTYCTIIMPIMVILVHFSKDVGSWGHWGARAPQDFAINEEVPFSFLENGSPP